MVDQLLDLPDWLGGSLTVLLTTAVGLLCYLVSYQLIFKYQSADLKGPASSLFRVIGILLSLMLSLAFGEVIVEWRDIQNSNKGEVMAIADLSYGLRSYESASALETHQLLVYYLEAVIEDDWPALADDRIGEKTRELISEVARNIREIEASTPIQATLKNQMLADIDRLYDYRRTRLINTLAQPPVYTFVIIIGFLITMSCFGVYQPQGPLIALVMLYTALVGIILYLILSLSDPFQGSVGIKPHLYENAFRMMEAREN